MILIALPSWGFKSSTEPPDWTEAVRVPGCFHLWQRRAPRVLTTCPAQRLAGEPSRPRDAAMSSARRAGPNPQVLSGGHRDPRVA